MAEATGAAAPRRAALDMLDAILGERRMMAEVQADPKGPLAMLDGPSRARAQRLVLATLRNIGRADRMLGPHLRKRPPLRVHNILRMALAEVFAEGGAPHGVVSSAVSLTRAARDTGQMAGLVNAVLRRATEQPPEVWAALAPQELPKWLRRPLIDTYGKAAVQAMELAHFQGAPLDLTPRDAGVTLPDATTLPTGSLRMAARGQVSDLPGFAEGAWWVQDAAAAIPARVLAPQPGENILDLCAAPGGKTMQLAAAGAKVTALDISGPRMGRMRENLARTGLAADLVVADALAWVPEAAFDAVLLDAPCSATGTIRRHPDLPFVKDAEDVTALVALQAALLDRALGFLRPGGRLLYCTCSLLKAEGEDQVTAALSRHAGLQTDAAALAFPGIDPDWLTPEGGLRLRPDYWAAAGGMDGFYVALLRWPG